MTATPPEISGFHRRSWPPWSKRPRKRSTRTQRSLRRLSPSGAVLVDRSGESAAHDCTVVGWQRRGERSCVSQPTRPRHLRFARYPRVVAARTGRCRRRRSPAAPPRFTRQCAPPRSGCRKPLTGCSSRPRTPLPCGGSFSRTSSGARGLGVCSVSRDAAELADGGELPSSWVGLPTGYVVRSAQASESCAANFVGRWDQSSRRVAGVRPRRSEEQWGRLELRRDSASPTARCTAIRHLAAAPYLRLGCYCRARADAEPAWFIDPHAPGLPRAVVPGGKGRTELVGVAVVFQTTSSGDRAYEIKPVSKDAVRQRPGHLRVPGTRGKRVAQGSIRHVVSGGGGPGPGKRR